MMSQLKPIQKSLHQLQNESRMETFSLYPGIELSFLFIQSDKITLEHEALKDILEINYCRSGRIGWSIGNASNVYLGSGDFSINTMDACADSIITLPNGYYEGLTLCIDLKELSANLPEVLADTGISGELLYHKFCKDRTFMSFAGNEQTQPIFSAFYGQPEEVQFAFWKLKALELLLYLHIIKCPSDQQLSEYRSEQVEIIREIHDYLIQNIRQKTTIEALSKKYLMNTTTLKTVFKAVYGTSIAAHIKEHKMERASELLLNTQDSLANIAEAIGYENQSKFTAAFKEHFKILPTGYRKKRQ